MSDVVGGQLGGVVWLSSVPGWLARGVLVAAVLAGGVLGAAGAVSADVVAQAGPAFVRLLRAMALIKLGLAVLVGAVLYWRLGAGVRVGRLAAYSLSACIMAAGPGLIWGLAHIGLGAVLLHGGLLATIILLWRDPGMALRIDEAIAARREAAI